jgi:hypothetical protein
MRILAMKIGCKLLKGKNRLPIFAKWNFQDEMEKKQSELKPTQVLCQPLPSHCLIRAVSQKHFR